MAERLTAMESELVDRIDELTLKLDAAEQKVDRLREALVELRELDAFYSMPEIGEPGFAFRQKVRALHSALHEQRKGEDG